MQSFFLTTTPPPLRWEKAPVGQASAQGAGRQARQILASNPVESPPDEAMRMPAVSQESRLWIRRAQASEQEWQPMHLSIRGAVRIFMNRYPCWLECRHSSVAKCTCENLLLMEPLLRNIAHFSPVLNFE
jgi:hypothetical protein